VSEHEGLVFDHDEPGTPEDAWCVLDAWKDVAELRPTSTRGDRPDRLVVAVAHPDDETLAVSGLITWAARAGIDCHVVVATDGEASHPGSPTHTPEALRARRQRELTEAVGHLNPGAVVDRLGLPDGELSTMSDPLAEALVDVVGPDTLVVSTWRNDGHPDHEAVAVVASEIARSVGARHLEAPIWLWHWGDDHDVPWGSVVRLELDEGQRECRERALAAYSSQHEPLSPHPADAPVLGPEMLAHFTRTFETYVEHEPAPDRGARAVGEGGGLFERLHREKPDPWALAESWYERRKRSMAMAALPTARLGRVLEVGCSVGVLTEQLARRADEVLAIDVSTAALTRAADRLAGSPDVAPVRFERRRVPASWPDGDFDTVVLSEVGYFLTAPQWLETLERACATARDSVLLVHWRHRAEGWPLDGEAAHRLAVDVARDRGFEVVTSVVDEDFLLDLFRPASAAGIAESEGKT